MVTIGQSFLVLARHLSRSFESRPNNPATSPALKECFDILSPFPGDSDVISRIERLSSSETKTALRLNGDRGFFGLKHRGLTISALSYGHSFCKNVGRRAPMGSPFSPLREEGLRDAHAGIG